jgi:segregation and condensation protein B
MNEDLVAQQVEALLFAEGGPIAKKELVKLVGVSPEELERAIGALARPGRGIVVVDDGKEVELRTAPQVAGKIEELRKEELSREVGRAGLEVLAAILYRGPLTRAEIDFIRGVNSSQTLRTLLIRGLLRKIENPRDERSFLYEPTTELLGHLGLATVTDLPDYAQVTQKLAELEASYREKQATETQTS